MVSQPVLSLTLGDRTLLVSSGLIRMSTQDGVVRVVTAIHRQDDGPYVLTLGDRI